MSRSRSQRQPGAAIKKSNHERPHTPQSLGQDSVSFVARLAHRLWSCCALVLLSPRKKQTEAVQERFAQQVSVPLLTDDLSKIITVIGERNTSSEAAGANLSRATAMIEGLLGPGNTGYTVTKIIGPATWPILQVTIQSKNAAVPAVWVLTSYDSRSGSRGAETNATGLASTLAAAQALASDQPNAPIHFIFLPHINDPESPVLETVTKLSEQIKSHSPPKAILCVEAMGAGESLWLSSHNTAAAPPNLVADIGKVYGTEIIYQEDKSDLSITLCEMNLPAVRIATRALLSSDEKTISSHSPPPSPPPRVASWNSSAAARNRDLLTHSR
ncbi:MAG: hypothetical protein HC767_12395 [Akkermansiaceae bacterium]|nr:hypothetical protein [Akkermansiaceae bacterium]